MRDDLLTVKQVSERMSVSKGTILNHMKSGKIPFEEVGGEGGNRLIPKSWVDNFLTEQTEFNQQ